METDFRLWCNENFEIVYNYGDQDIIFNDADLLEVKNIFENCLEGDKLKRQEKIYLFQAVAALIGNIKKELEILVEREPTDIETTIKALQDIIKAQDKVFKVVFYAGKKKLYKRYSIENGDLIYKVILALMRNYPTNEPGAERIVEKIKIVNGKKRGVPDFVCILSFEIDQTLKRLFPKITTGAIIIDIFEAADFPNILECAKIYTNYCDINNIENRIKEGERKSNHKK